MFGNKSLFWFIRVIKSRPASTIIHVNHIFTTMQNLLFIILCPKSPVLSCKISRYKSLEIRQPGLSLLLILEVLLYWLTLNHRSREFEPHPPYCTNSMRLFSHRWIFNYLNPILSCNLSLSESRFDPRNVQYCVLSIILDKTFTASAISSHFTRASSRKRQITTSISMCCMKHQRLSKSHMHVSDCSSWKL